jgi:hypothetical protein
VSEVVKISIPALSQHEYLVKEKLVGILRLRGLAVTVGFVLVVCTQLAMGCSVS